MSRARLLVIGVAVLLVGGVVFVQTETGFRRLVVPLVGGLVPGTLEARGGRLGLGGTLEARGLRFDAPERGVTAVVEELVADVSLVSAAFGDKLHVDRLRLVGAEIDLVPPAGARESEPADEDEARRPLDFRGLIAVSVAEVEVRDLVFRSRDEGGTQIEVGPLQLGVSRLVAGETGTIELSTPAEVRGPENAHRVDELKLSARVAQTAGGALESWKATAEAGITGIGGSDATSFSLGSDGSVRDDALAASTHLRAERAGSLLGEARLHATTSADPEARNVVNASLVLHSVTEEFVNPLIAPLGRGRVASARIDGKLDVVADAPLDLAKPPRRATGELSIGRLDYRTLRIASARAELDASPGSFSVRLHPSQVNQGRISGALVLEATAGQERLEVDLKTLKLDLVAISQAFREDLPAKVEGVLDLDAALSSQVPAGTDVRERAQGSIRTRIKRARIEGFNLMGFLATRSGVEAFQAIPLDDFDVDASAPVLDGVASFHEAEVRSAAMQMLVNGTVGLTGSLDLTIEAFVGPGIGSMLEELGIDIPVITRAERLVALPAAIRVSGPFADLRYAATAPRTRERTGEAVGSGSEAVDKAAREVEGLFRRLRK